MPHAEQEKVTLPEHLMLLLVFIVLQCYPVICVFLFLVIVLSFGFWLLIVSFVWLLGIYIFYFCTKYHINSKRMAKKTQWNDLITERLNDWVTEWRDDGRTSVTLYATVQIITEIYKPTYYTIFNYPQIYLIFDNVTTPSTWHQRIVVFPLWRTWLYLLRQLPCDHSLTV